LPDSENTHLIVRTTPQTRGDEINSVMSRLPADLRPSRGSFEDVFARACAEVALSARPGEGGAAIVPAGAVLHLARLLCGRSLASGDCHDACRLQRQCIGSSKLVLASFGSQARACIKALGLEVEEAPRATLAQAQRRAPQPRLARLRKVGSAA
jgi:hypothetical protein